jgi:hypothetical protein
MLMLSFPALYIPLGVITGITIWRRYSPTARRSSDQPPENTQCRVIQYE